MSGAAGGARLEAVGPWEVRVGAGQVAAGEGVVEVRAAATVAVAPADRQVVAAERHEALPEFDAAAAGWAKGRVLAGVATQETSAKGMLDPDSLTLSATPGGEPLQAGHDYAADLEWGTFGRLPGGRIRPDQPVFAAYRYGRSRLDAVVVDGAGRVRLRPGAAHVAVPRPPELEPDEVRLGHVWVPGRLERLGPDELFPILETAYPEDRLESPPAAGPLSGSRRRLRRGEPLRLLAWGDSVTDASYLDAPGCQRWQAQLAARLRGRFPNAAVELVTEAWGGRNTASYLAEPPGSEHHFGERVLGAGPDLVVSEFVNDAGLPLPQLERQYEDLLEQFRGRGIEWLILTPHYVRPDWMGLTRQRDVDEDPRPYVHFLRRFAAARGVALADAARRWGRLWRQGIPYTTLLLNAINHPDERGMRVFADSAIRLLAADPAG